MVDYDYSIPGSVGGLMRIRDTGSRVQFMIRAGNSIAYDYDLYWNGVVNGVNVGGKARYEAGGAWLLVGDWAVSYSQTVTFRKTSDSGSQGLGGTGAFSHYIQRESIPPAPKPLGIDQITGSSMRYRFQSQGDGGSPILQWQIGYGTSATTPQLFVTSSGTSTLSGLTKNEDYYFWSRGRNEHGWGPWSTRMSAKTLNTPGAPTVYAIFDILHTSATFKMKDPASNGGASITTREYQFSEDNDFSGAPIYSFATRLIAVDSNGDYDWWARTYPPYAESGRGDLYPGTRYYWRARCRNSVGAGPWSSTVSALTLPGVFVKVAGIWKLGVPYVRLKGVWKAGIVYAKKLGKWGYRPQ